MKLNELIQIMSQHAELVGHPITAAAWDEIELSLMRSFPGEHVYIPKSSSRKAAIAEAANRLPTAVVAERFGVSKRWVNRIVNEGLK